MEFKEGQEITLHVKGAGVTTYEDSIVDKVEDGVIYASDREFDSKGNWLGKDVFMGFDFKITPK